MKQADNHTSVERLARRRAGAKMGWYIHATVYVLVNLFLVALAASHDGHWAVFPLLGWGLGLLIHGAVVFFIAPGGNLFERLVERERRKLGSAVGVDGVRSGDPW